MRVRQAIFFVDDGWSIVEEAALGEVAVWGGVGVVVSSRDNEGGDVGGGEGGGLSKCTACRLKQYSGRRSTCDRHRRLESISALRVSAE